MEENEEIEEDELVFSDEEEMDDEEQDEDGESGTFEETGLLDLGLVVRTWLVRREKMLLTRWLIMAVMMESLKK